MKRNAIIFLLILSLSMVNGYAISLCNAKDIEYKASDTSWDVDTVSDALNDLYENNSCKIGDGILEFLKQPLVFSYTGGSQQFVVPVSGTYKIELWGAQGGTTDDKHVGGKGAYVSGEIELKSNQKLYIYVGGTTEDQSGGYNGGGAGGAYVNYGYGLGGGGATDIRLVGEETGDFASLKSRIMVAAGGGGGALYSSSTGEAWGEVQAIGGGGGGLNGINGSYKFNVYDSRWSGIIRDDFGGFGGNQTSGGLGGRGYGTIPSSPDATFGIGSSQTGQGAAGGGGGYYGGGASIRNGFGGGGGSSYISGHNGCKAVLEDSTADEIKHSESSIHYTTMIFTNTRMVDGEGYEWTDVRGEKTGMPTFDGLSTMNGNASGGYAKITFINTH